VAAGLISSLTTEVPVAVGIKGVGVATRAVGNRIGVDVAVNIRVGADRGVGVAKS
jgi:hypothetical protein